VEEYMGTAREDQLEAAIKDLWQQVQHLGMTLTTKRYGGEIGALMGKWMKRVRDTVEGVGVGIHDFGPDFRVRDSDDRP
jgi:hypothetical protein